jgi:hypothetical protein
MSDTKNEMKTLTMGGKTYEVVDEKARADIANIQANGVPGNNQTLEEMLQGFDSDPRSVKTYVDKGLGSKADADHDHDKKYQAKGDYVVAEEGKGLSTNDFTDYYKNQVINSQQTDMDLRDIEMALEGLAEATPGFVKTYIDDGLAGKVDAVEGKCLSTNDFTDELKSNLVNYGQDVSDVRLKLDGFDSEWGSVKTYIDNAVAGCAKPEDIPTMDEILSAVREGLPAAEEVKL